MADVFKFHTGAESFFGLYHALGSGGDRVSPRGQETRELRNVIIRIADPARPLMSHLKNRHMNTRLAALETLQLIGGCSSPELMRRAAPNTEQFTDGGYFHGAYGPRLRSQFPKVAQRLEADPSTRQAVATIWDPLHDLHTDGMHDYPCTIYLSFCIRNRRLEMTTHMRSNDLWWGWTYDIVQFTQVQLTMANILGYEVGPYTHYADSFHYYLRDVDAMERVEASVEPLPTRRLGGLVAEDWPTVAARAREIMFNPGEVTAYDQTEHWLRQQMLRVVGT